MNWKFASCFVAALLLLVSAARTAVAEVCRNCNSSKCSSCTVQVGIYGYTRPTWRPWPTAKEEGPGEREKTDRQLIRPEPFETPAPETEADGAPRLTPPDTRPPGFEPMPPDDAPALPPQLRNKQPIPLQDSSRRAIRPPATTISPNVNSQTNARMTAAAKPSAPAMRRSLPMSQRRPAPRRVVSLNIPISAQMPVEGQYSNNPLRLAGGTNAGPTKPTTVQRAAANMPVAVGNSARTPRTSTRPESNPLR